MHASRSSHTHDSHSSDNHAHTATDRGGDDGARPPIDYRPLREAGRIATKWLLDVARSAATEPDDRESIDRVERAALATVAGVPRCCRPAELRASEEDVLVTAGILIERLEIDFRIPGLSQIFGALYEAFDWAQRSAPSTTGAAAPRHAPGNHAAQRHAAAEIPSWISMWQSSTASRAPRVAHGAADGTVARVFVLPIR